MMGGPVDLGDFGGVGDRDGGADDVGVENEVDLVGVAALVGTEHDHVGGGIAELLLVESLVLTEKLHVSATALKTI